MRSIRGTRTAGVVLTLSLALGAGALDAAPNAKRRPAPAAKPAPKPAAKNPVPAQKAWEELLASLRSKLETASDREKAGGEAVGALKQFAQQYPRDPLTDQARLIAGQLQMDLLRQPAAAAESFRSVAERPVDKKMQPVGQLFLARAQVAAGKVEDAEKLLQALARNQDPRIQESARQALAELTLRPGQKPPSFTANDLDGNPQSPDRFQGKVLLIDFWATWCGPCRAELPTVKAVYDKYREKGFAILAVSLDEDKEALQRFVKDEKMAWPQLFDGKGWRNEIAQLYGVSAIPRTLLLDRQGVIRHTDLRGPALEKAVAELLGADAPAAEPPAAEKEEPEE
jgi:thiol-disulfide isomerase/thioredoxin